MSFGATTKTPKEKKTANIDSDTLNTNQEAIPVTYAGGRNRIAVQFISPAYNRTVKKVTSSSGGKGGDSQVTGHKYYIDLLAAVCVCGHRPVDAITEVIIDSEVAWTGNVRRVDGVPYVSITLKSYGEMRLYWGTLDQPGCDWFAFHFNGTPATDGTPAQPARTDQHPAYRGVCYVALRQFYLGQDRTNMPNFEVVVERGPSWFAGEELPDVSDRGSNAIALLYEWLTDDWFGVGLDPARLVKTRWLASLAAAEAAGHRLSPLVTSATGIRSLVAQLFEYFDGWIRREGDQLAAGFWRHGATDVSGVPTLDYDVIAAEPALKSTGYGDTINQATVIYRDQTAYFHDTTQVRYDEANRRIVGEIRPESLQRSWIIDTAHALAYAVEYLNLRSQPSYAGPVQVKRESAAAGLPGDLVRVSSDAYGLSIICRIIERANPADRSGLLTLSVESERGLYPALFLPVPPPRVPDFIVVATVIEHARMVLLPAGLKDSANAQVAPLAERPDPTLTGFRLHVSRESAVYDLLVGDCAFAVRGELTAAYAATTADLDLGGTLAIEIAGIDADLVQSQSDAARDANELLLFLENEILSVGEVTAVGAGVYTFTVARGLYGTVKAAHAVGAEGYFVRRENLVRAERVGTIEPGAAIHFKLQTHNQRADQDLGEALVIAYNVPEASAVGLILNLHVETDVKVTKDGALVSRVLLFWGFPPDQGITGFESAIRPASGTEDDWVYRSGTSPQVLFRVEPGVAYLVKVRAVNALGERSYWSDVVAITSATAARFSVTGLELANGYGGANTYFYGRDAKFQWRLNSPIRAEEIGQEGDAGVTDGTYDPLFADYEFGVFDRATHEQVYSHLKRGPKIHFSFETNAECPGGPRASFRVGVRARDLNGSVSPWTYLDVTNPPPGPPSALIIAHTGLAQNHLIWVPAEDLDIRKTQVLFSEGTDYGAATVAGVVHGATSVFAHVGVQRSKRLHYWVRHKDNYGSWGQPYPPADQPGIGVEMGGLVLGSGNNQLNADISGNLWVGSGDYASSPVRFSSDGSIYVSGTGNSTIDAAAINPVIKSPKMVPAGTSFDTLLTVQLLSKTAGADLIYTTDGTTPTLTNGTRAANGVTVNLNVTTTIQAIGLKLGTLSTDGGRTGPGAVRAQTYTLSAGACADPSLSPPGGTFSPSAFPVRVTMACATAGATIRWSTGGMPRSAAEGNAYAGPVTVGSGQTLYAQTFKAGATSGPGRSDAYLALNDPWSGGPGGPDTYDPPTRPGVQP